MRGSAWSAWVRRANTGGRGAGSCAGSEGGGTDGLCTE